VSKPKEDGSGDREQTGVNGSTPTQPGGETDRDTGGTEDTSDINYNTYVNDSNISNAFDLIHSHGGEIWVFLKYLAASSFAGAVVALTWFQAWTKVPVGYPRQLVERGNEVVTLGDVPAFSVAAVLGLVCALATVVLWDTYKRSEILYVPAGVFSGTVVFVSLAGWGPLVASWPSALAGVAVGFVVGFQFTDLGEKRVGEGGQTFEKTLRRLGGVLIVLSAVGAIDALVVYQGSLGRGGTLEWELTESGFLVPAMGFVGTWVIYHLFSEELLVYTNSKDVALFGPSRSGKTYFIAALAYSLDLDKAKRGPAKPVVTNTALSNGDDNLLDKFSDGDFENIGSTELDKCHLYRIEFPHGLLFQKRTVLRFIDFGGEHIATTDESADGEFDASADEVDLNDDVETYGDVEDVYSDLYSTEPDTQGVEPIPEDDLDESHLPDIDWVGNDPDPQSDDVMDEIEAYVNANESLQYSTLVDILNVYLSKADTIAFVLPMDDTVDEDAIDEFDPDAPDRPLEKKDRIKQSRYEQVYEQMIDEFESKNTFFLMTMSDWLRTAFGEWHDEDVSSREQIDPRNHKRTFREYVTNTFMRQNRDFAPASYLNVQYWTPTAGEVKVWTKLRETVTGPKPFVPVYIEPDTDADSDEMVPKLEPDFKQGTYPLFGLRDFLRRLR